ncbi:hypothetical protein MKN04_16165 [Paenibacillus polymyxa]|uniref:hypothetical protein n=1 Tax=Paenibacillus polymyxa TaxID=1406 RepID=UPI0004D7C4DF|nr:hypothetical protein [Paenibacillus polymyxa]KEO77625.1 hypothetical protein EL23_16125 [Paenibacillus polymyxa]MCH6189180.1 hypothetical protein [Paenibacillus polymyxa]WRL58365.1 hypothetical protein U3G77_09000 [Paenibacillus polymyxa]
MTQKANNQAIINIIRQGQVWESVESAEKELHYYHITDALNRKWQTIGLNVSDAIQVFEHGNDDNWTRIIEPAPYNPDLSINDLINMLNISPEATGIRNDMQIILNTVERRNEYVSRIVNVNRESRFLLLHQMKDEYLQHSQLTDDQFMQLYAVNPVEALSMYFLQSIDIIAYWEWKAADGTAEKAIQYKRVEPLFSFIQAVERAEDEAIEIVSGF